MWPGCHSSVTAPGKQPGTQGMYVQYVSSSSPGPCLPRSPMMECEVPCHMRCVPCHMSCVSCIMPYATCHMASYTPAALGLAVDVSDLPDQDLQILSHDGALEVRHLDPDHKPARSLVRHRTRDLGIPRDPKRHIFLISTTGSVARSGGYPKERDPYPDRVAIRIGCTDTNRHLLVDESLLSLVVAEADGLDHRGLAAVAVAINGVEGEGGGSSSASTGSGSCATAVC